MATSKVVLMTGCVSGIGLATATRLARDPDQRFLVIATVISFKEQDDLVAAVGDRLNKTLFIKELDITKDEQIFMVVEETLKRHGRIDILLYIAGIGTAGQMESLSRQQIELAFNVNTLGIIRLTQAVLPHMKRRKMGRIITVTSMSGRMGSPFLEVYCASKFATEGFMESIAPLARLHNIGISMVEPGPVKTRLLEGDIYDDVQKVIDDESLDDVDRRCAHEWLGHLKRDSALTTTDVCEKILEVIDAEKPLLRYPVPEETSRELAELLSDTSGEMVVVRNVKRLRYEKE